MLHVHLCLEQPRAASNQRQQQPSHIKISSKPKSGARRTCGADTPHPGWPTRLAEEERGRNRGRHQETHEHRITPTGHHRVNYTPATARRPRPRSWAFSATTTVDADMRTAPSAGESRIPARASTPAASGIATAL